MWSWRGCVQGSGSISKYSNQLKNNQKIWKKNPKNKSDILYCHDMDVAVMSPYEFTSKTYSLSTEDLGKFFIHWFIHLPSNTVGTFYLKQKNTCKMVKKSLENEEKISGK